MDYETNKIITQEELDKMGEELSNYAELYINQQFKKIPNDMDNEKKQEIAYDVLDNGSVHFYIIVEGRKVSDFIVPQEIMVNISQDIRKKIKL